MVCDGLQTRFVVRHLDATSGLGLSCGGIVLRRRDPARPVPARWPSARGPVLGLWLYIASVAAADLAPIRFQGGALAATQPSALSTFTLFAEQSLVMAKENLLRRGHAGVNSPTGLAKIGPSSRLDDAATLVAARVKLAPFASIGDAFATEISGPPSAMARGTESRGQFEILTLPPLPAFSPGPGAVTVAPEGTRILLPGQYDALSVGRGGTVILAGGEYDFRTLALRRDASVLVAAPVTVKVRDTFSMATGTAIAPMSGSGLGPDDISVVFGSSRALRLGNEAILTASFFAPEAAVKVGKGAYLTGRIVGRTITLQSGVISTLPICGDELVEVGEECDGANDAICPGACSADCTCNVARPSAALHLEKTVGGLDADELPGLTVKPGGLLTFGFAVSNTGNAILENITIVDDRLGAVGTIAVLAPGATEMLSAVSTAPKQGTLLTAATAIGFPAGGGAGVSSTDLASITVQAQSTAQAPKTVSGEAYGFFAQLVTPAGSIMVPKTPHVVLPAAGGVESQQVLSVGVPNLAATGTLTAETEGFIDSSGASAQSTATVQNVNLLNGLISADTVIAMASSMCGGTAATSTAEGSTFVGLVVSGIPINVTPAPNTTIPLPGVGTVILNEQIPGGDGVNNTELTVNMIHVILDSPALTGDIIVASAHSDAHCPPVTCLKTSVQTVLDPKKGRFPGNEGFDVTVRGDLGQSVQEAIDRAADVNGDGYIIIGVVKDGTGNLGGTIRESIVIDDVYALPFALTGCSVTLEDPTPTDGEPTARIAATASSPDLFVMDLHAAGSDVAGWLVEGDGRSFRNVNAFSGRVSPARYETARQKGTTATASW